MKIHTKDIFVYYLNPDSDAFVYRRKPLENILDTLGFKYERHVDMSHGVRHVKIAGGHRNIVEAAIKRGIFPFLILEDDVRLNTELPSCINIPENANIIYWGASTYGSGIEGELSIEEYDEDYYRIYRSLGGHALLIPSLKSAEYYLSILEESITKMQHLDIILAVSSNQNIFLTPKDGPYFYQNEPHTKPITKFLWKDIKEKI